MQCVVVSSLPKQRMMVYSLERMKKRHGPLLVTKSCNQHWNQVASKRMANPKRSEIQQLITKSSG